MPAAPALKAVARILDVPERNLYARAQEGLITVERRPSGRVRVLADPDVCRREVAELRCRAPGCDQPAHRAGRFCSHACSVRKYAGETRVCESEECAKSFEVPGHRAVQPGQGRFCSPACVIAHRWKHAPETFPQSERRGAEKACRICRSTRYRPPSFQHLECCSEECAHEAFRQWLASPEGREHRADLEKAQREWQERNKAEARIEAKRAGRLLTDEVMRECGIPSLPTITRDLPARGKLDREKDERGFVTIPIRGAANVQSERVGSTVLFGRYAKQLAEAGGKKAGRPGEVTAEQEARILERHEKGGKRASVRAIAQNVGVGRGKVERVLSRRRETVTKPPLAG
jgi:hypothetical protein